MRIHFSSSPKRVELTGARADFAAWAQILRQERAFLAMDEGKGGIRSEIVPKAKVSIAWDAATREVQIAGDAEWIDILAEGVEGFSQDGESEAPWFVEYFDYLAPKSLCLVCKLDE